MPHERPFPQGLPPLKFTETVHYGVCAGFIYGAGVTLSIIAIDALDYVVAYTIVQVRSFVPFIDGLFPLTTRKLSLL